MVMANINKIQKIKANLTLILETLQKSNKKLTRKENVRQHSALLDKTFSVFRKGGQRQFHG